MLRDVATFVLLEQTSDSPESPHRITSWQEVASHASHLTDVLQHWVVALLSEVACELSALSESATWSSHASSCSTCCASWQQSVECS